MTATMRRIGWSHPKWSESLILSDGSKAVLEARAPQDPTYVDGWVPVFVPGTASGSSETDEDSHTWAICADCGGNIFRHYTWSHEGGTPPQDHDAAPSEGCRCYSVCEHRDDCSMAGNGGSTDA